MQPETMIGSLASTTWRQEDALTFALQKLRGMVDGFDEWYTPIQEGLANDPVCGWFKIAARCAGRTRRRPTIKRSRSSVSTSPRRPNS